MSTIVAAQAAMGYTPARERPACCNCWNAHELTGANAAEWHCHKGNFRVTAMAVCEHYSPRRQGQPSEETPA